MHSCYSRFFQRCHPPKQIVDHLECRSVRLLEDRRHIAPLHMRIDGGGHVNGSFLKAGLIDEFSLVLAPIADGTTGAPTVFEAGEDPGKRKATRFKLQSVKKIYNDFLWIRYVKR